MQSDVMALALILILLLSTALGLAGVVLPPRGDPGVYMPGSDIPDYR